MHNNVVSFFMYRWVCMYFCFNQNKGRDNDRKAVIFKMTLKTLKPKKTI